MLASTASTLKNVMDLTRVRDCTAKSTSEVLKTLYERALREGECERSGQRPEDLAMLFPLWLNWCLTWIKRSYKFLYYLDRERSTQKRKKLSFNWSTSYLPDEAWRARRRSCVPTERHCQNVYDYRLYMPNCFYGYANVAVMLWRTYRRSCYDANIEDAEDSRH